MKANQLETELCKLANKPAFIYTTHNSDACKFCDSYANSMSSNGHKRDNEKQNKHKNEYHRAEKTSDLKHELKILQNQVKKISS